jgi:hypothetical protein
MTNDERPLRRAIKKLVTSAPSSGTPAAIGASSSAAEQWDALSSEFENVELLVTKAGLVGNMEERMRASYRAKGDEMGEWGRCSVVRMRALSGHGLKAEERKAARPQPL